MVLYKVAEPSAFIKLKKNRSENADMSSDNKVLKTILAASLRCKNLYLDMTKAPKSK